MASLPAQHCRTRCQTIWPRTMPPPRQAGRVPQRRPLEAQRRPPEAGPPIAQRRHELRTPPRRPPEGPEPPAPQAGWPASAASDVDDDHPPGPRRPRPLAPRPQAPGPIAPRSSQSNLQARFHPACSFVFVHDGADYSPTVAAGLNPPTAQPHVDDGLCPFPPPPGSLAPGSLAPGFLAPGSLEPRTRARSHQPRFLACVHEEADELPTFDADANPPPAATPTDGIPRAIHRERRQAGPWHHGLPRDGRWPDGRWRDGRRQECRMQDGRRRDGRRQDGR